MSETPDWIVLYVKLATGAFWRPSQYECFISCAATRWTSSRQR